MPSWLADGSLQINVAKVPVTKPYVLRPFTGRQKPCGWAAATSDDPRGTQVSLCIRRRRGFVLAGVALVEFLGKTGTASCSSRSCCKASSKLKTPTIRLVRSFDSTASGRSSVVGCVMNRNAAAMPHGRCETATGMFLSGIIGEPRGSNRCAIGV